MKTEDLIASLAADPTPPHRPAALKATALAAAVAVTLAGFAAVLGLRHDLHTALGTWAFAAKLAILVSAFVAAVLAARLSMNPLVERPWPRIATAVAAAIFLASVGLEVASYPVSAWGPRLVGDYGVVCLVSIALLAAAPLAA
ncbi:MAG TPA: NrsF family protein, partial [Hyphomicrobiaceae bacterium]|nr:NrsF family protein [Hyphomicrobiaceae bacterium]